jgi:hypothetical protein
VQVAVENRLSGGGTYVDAEVKSRNRWLRFQQQRPTFLKQSIQGITFRLAEIEKITTGLGSGIDAVSSEFLSPLAVEIDKKSRRLDRYGVVLRLLQKKAMNEAMRHGKLPSC